MKNIRVFLADWQILFREGIHFILSGEEDFEVIGETTGNEEVLDLIEKNPPTLAIINANGNKPSGIEITRRIKHNLPSVAVILIRDNDDDEEQGFAAIKSGANACLTKNMTPEELIDIARKTSADDYPISRMLLKPAIASRTLIDFEFFASIGGEVNELMSHLLPGELELLKYIADGSPLQEAKVPNAGEESVLPKLNLIRQKLVKNDRNREVIEAAQSTLAFGIHRPGIPSPDYITRDEFNAFKESLMERFKSLIG